MSDSNEGGFASTGARRIGLAIAAAIAAAGVSSSVESGMAADLERAYVERATGISRALHRAEGMTRVRIITSSQPLLRAAERGGIRSQLRPAAAVPGSALGIGAAERAAARRSERSFEAGIDDLGGAGARTLSRLRSAAAAVRAHGGRVLELEVAPAALIARIPVVSLGALGRARDVGSIEPAPASRRLSGLGTTVVGAPAWWGAGFTGGQGAADTVPADAAIESEAADPTHPAFAGTTVDNDPSQPVTDHGTHTGGVIASGDGAYPGVSYGLDRLIGSGSTAYELGIDGPLGSGAEDPAETINVSFGSAAANDSEDNPDDILTNVFGIGQAFGAGNENVDGTPTVGNIGRNVLTVAGFNDVATTDPADDVVLGISSRGPTPGGRKKPDLTAPAAAVMAPSAAWNSPPSNPDFTAMTGTSFAAPHVAGAMTLLEGAGIPDPMAQRAILINSARDWSGSNTGLIGWTPPQDGWKPEVGWGALDLAGALAERSNYRLGEVKAGEAAYYAATVSGGGKATLAYELRGYFVGFPDPGTQTLTYTQSNLDLHQYLADGSEIPPPADPGHGGGPDAIDPDDTVEQVRAPAGGPHSVIYKVEAASTVEGATAEPFALTSAGPPTPLAPAVVAPIGVDADPGGPVRCGQPVTIRAMLRNGSDDLTAAGARVEIDLPTGVELVAGTGQQEVSGGDLAPAETSEEHSWTVEAGTAGVKQLTIVGTGGALGTEFLRTAVVAIAVDCDPPNTVIDAGPIGPTNDPALAYAFSARGGGDAFECSLDDGPFEACRSPHSLGGLGEGAHTFAVRALDAAGNVDPSPAMRSFTVDRSIVDPTIRLRSKRIRAGGRRVGSVKVGLGEPGTARIAPTARAGRRDVRLRGRRIAFQRGGRTRVRLTVPRGERPLVRKVRRRGGKLRVKVVAAFTDRVGNEAVLRSVRYRAR